jgi:hypothetical protein
MDGGEKANMVLVVVQLRPARRNRESVARFGARITGPDASPLHQPSPRSWLPDGASTLKDMRQLLRASHRNQLTKLTELTWANMIRNVDRSPRHAADSSHRESAPQAARPMAMLSPSSASHAQKAPS